MEKKIKAETEKINWLCYILTLDRSVIQEMHLCK